MSNKRQHITKLGYTEIPTCYPRDNDVACISIPLFHSKSGYSPHLSVDKEFNETVFRNNMVRGAAWACLSWLTNTDLGDNGIPIYFHVEDLVYDIVCDELAKYGVPENWLVKMNLGDWTPAYKHPEIGSPELSKKFSVLLDKSINTQCKIIADADAFVYRRIGDPVLKWYDIVKNEFTDKIVVQFITDERIPEIDYINWLCDGLAIDHIEDQATAQRGLKAKEEECYGILGLETEYKRNRIGTQIMSFPSNHDFVGFIEKNITQCYIDEPVLTMYAQAMNLEVHSSRDLDIPILGYIGEKDDLENYLDVSRIIHPTGDNDSHNKWFRRFKQGINGQNRENSVKLFQSPQKHVHIFPVAHNLVSPEFSPCAFAQKARKLAIMCKHVDHHVTFYGNELDKDVVECDEFVVVSDEEMLTETYGDFRDQSNFYWFRDDDYNSRVTREKIIHHYGKRHQKGDILCYTFGHQQRKLYDKLFSDFGDALHIESGIGYYQPYMHYKVFESKSHMHYTYGEAGQRYWEWEQIDEDKRPQRDFNNTFHYGMTQWQDKVICNSWGKGEFDFNPEKGGDYLLFIGRIVGGKGVEIAMRVADALNKRLVVAGQGDFEKELGFTPWDCVELVGMVGPEKRRELYYNCEAVLAPTKYLDVLCGVVIEAGFAGRPVVGPAFGGPSEVIEHKLTGYQCRSFCQYVRATANVHLIDPVDCYNNAMRYTNEAIAVQYDEYFDHITRYAENNCSPYWYFNLERNIDW